MHKSKEITNLLDQLTNDVKKLDINNDEKNKILKTISDIKKIKKEKKQKDENKPKNPKNTFMLFLDDIRKIKKNENTSKDFPENLLTDIKEQIVNNDSFTNLSSISGIYWKKMSENDKSGYEKTYNEAKKKHKINMDKYNKKMIKQDDTKVITKRGRPKKQIN